MQPFWIIFYNKTDYLCSLLDSLYSIPVYLGMEKIKFNRIKAVLAEKDRTSKWLYEQMGTSKITVSRWVRNDRQPSIETLFIIAELLEVQVETLLLTVDDIKKAKELLED